MRAAWEDYYRTRRRPWAGAIELPKLPQGSLVLETGCGGGRLLVPLMHQRPGLTVVGLDIARSALTCLSRPCPGGLVQADVAALPFRAQSFDAVICRHVLGHLPEAGRRAAASEMLRVVKPGGSLFFEGFSTGDGRFGKGRQVEPATFARGDGIWHHYFSPEEVGRLFAIAREVDLQERTWEERAGPRRMRRALIVGQVRRTAQPPSEGQKADHKA